MSVNPTVPSTEGEMACGDGNDSLFGGWVPIECSAAPGTTSGTRSHPTWHGV